VRGGGGGIVGHHCLNILFIIVTLPSFLYGIQLYRSWSILLFYIVSTVFQISVHYLYFLYYNSEGRERIITKSTSNHWFCSRLRLGFHSNWYRFYIHLETSIGVSITE